MKLNRIEKYDFALTTATATGTSTKTFRSSLGYAHDRVCEAMRRHCEHITVSLRVSHSGIWTTIKEESR